MLVLNQTSFLIIICIVLIIIMIIDRTQSDTRDEFSGRDIHEGHMRGKDRDIRSADGKHDTQVSLDREEKSPGDNTWKDSKKKPKKKSGSSGFLIAFIVIFIIMFANGFLNVLGYFISYISELIGLF